MTAQSDLDWLADESGDLRPAVADALAGVPPRAARRPVEPHPRDRLLGPTLAAALGAVLIVSALRGCQPRAVHTTASSTQTGTVFGDAVNLRASPALASGALGKLFQGEALQVLDRSGGWIHVRSARLGEGWVFGAYVRGVNGAAVPGLMVRRIALPAQIGSGLLQRGDKVVVESVGVNGYALLALPDGRHVQVPADAVVLVR